MLLYHFSGSFRIIDDGFYFSPMPYNAPVVEQSIDFLLPEVCNAINVETMKSGSKILSLGQNSAPTQTGLKTLQAQFFKQTLIIIDGETPFLIVIVEKFWCCATPFTAAFAIRALNRITHSGSG